MLFRRVFNTPKTFHFELTNQTNFTPSSLSLNLN